MTTKPRFPIYIPSKSRADTAKTPSELDRIGVPYRIIVEEQQYDSYRENYSEDKLLILDKTFQDEYETLDELGDTISKGAGPARNFAWQHSIDEGHKWHWVMDDNIRIFARLHKNKKLRVGDGTMFYAMEDFGLRYTNIGTLGPHYWMFAPSRTKRPPFIVGTRVYSCNLIRNDLPMRWRGRHNEDTILSLDMLKKGWATIQFYAFIQDKLTTHLMKGGNTEAFYADQPDRYRNTRMLYNAHPDVTRIVQRYGRIHHHVDYGKWRGMKLIKDPNYKPPDKNPYNLQLVKRPKHEISTSEH